MNKIIINIILLLTIAQLSWSQAPPSQHFVLEAHAPQRGVGLVTNLSEQGFAGLYYQSGSNLEGWVGYVGTGAWSDTSTFQIGSFNKPMHFLPTGQRAMAIDASEVAVRTTLHVDADHHVLYGDSMSGGGSKFFWFPEEAAVRAGTVTGSHWDADGIGLHSVAFGKNTSATQSEAAAFGDFNSAINIQSTAFGKSSLALGIQSSAFGLQTEASGTRATSWGELTSATAINATAWGLDNISSGDHSTAWGEGNKAQSIYETVIGSYADTIAGANASNFVASDQLWAVGNGASDVNRSNALTTYKNGNTTIGGALQIEQTSKTLLVNDVTLEVGDKGYMSVRGGFEFNGDILKVILNDGSHIGQVLLLSCSSLSFILQDGSASNTNLTSTKTLNEGDTIQLVWNGDKWLEVTFSDN